MLMQLPTFSNSKIVNITGGPDQDQDGGRHQPGAQGAGGGTPPQAPDKTDGRFVRTEGQVNIYS